MSSLQQALERHAAERPAEVALDADGVLWTWAELAARVTIQAETREPGVGARVQAPMSPPEVGVVNLLAGERMALCIVPVVEGLPQVEVRRREEEASCFRGPTPGVLIYTSGTTGNARGVRLTYEALRTSARMVISAAGLEAGDAWYSSLPMSHVGGIGVVFRCVLAGARMVLRRRFDPLDSAAWMTRGATHMSMVARMLERVLDVPWDELQASCGARPALGRNRLKLIMVGGGPTSPALLRRAGAARLPVSMTYGMTEAGSTLTLERGGTDGLPLSAGFPLDEVQLRIGEGDIIEVKSPAMMEGYDPNGEDAVSPFTADGWLRTRDLGQLLEDGRLVVFDRRSDLIVTGGENVAPTRVEGVIASHHAVDEVAVIGMPDDSWGQRVVAVVRMKGGAELPPLEWFRARMAPHELPKDWLVSVEPLPRDGAGKLRRREVKDALLAEG